MFEQPSYQRILDAEKQKIEANGKIYIGPSTETLEQCGIPLNKKRFIDQERNQVLFAGKKYEGPSPVLLNQIQNMTEEKFKLLFTLPDIQQRFIDRKR